LYLYYTALKNELDKEFSTYEGEVHTRFWWGNLRERNNFEDPGVYGIIIIRWIFRTGLIWLRIERGGGHLLKRY
jgi:hypothetical protein